MLSIGEFSHICKVSTKTLRYYVELGLILPVKITLETGYRYYSIDQLEQDLLCIQQGKRVMSYLDDIDVILTEVD